MRVCLVTSGIPWISPRYGVNFCVKYLTQLAIRRHGGVTVGSCTIYGRKGERRIRTMLDYRVVCWLMVGYDRLYHHFHRREWNFLWRFRYLYPYQQTNSDLRIV